MANVKLKFRPSTVMGKEGSLFFQIIHRRQVRQIDTGLRVRQSEWDAKCSAVVTPVEERERTMYLLSITETLECLRRDLLAIISRLGDRGGPYTAQDVIAAFNARQAADGIVAFTRRLIDEFRGVGKRAAVRRFEISLNSLLRYTGGREVAWADLTPTFVVGYEAFLARRGLCRNSTSFYMRNLRAIVNRAVERDVRVPANLFKHVYMGIDKTVKRAVGLEAIRMIRDLDLAGLPELDFARKVFLLSFYLRGMSFVDIAFLKKGDLNNGVITYSRRKTRRQLKVRLEPQTREIIDSFGQSKTSFLLPIITDERQDADRQYEKAYFRVNRNLKKVGAMLGLENKLTLYVARHAWASIAHSNNVALSTISKAMGHDSEKTTIIYLQSLDTSSVDKANSDIIRLIDSRTRHR